MALEECFIDATLAAAKSGGAAVGLTHKRKGSKLQLIVDAKGVPLALSLDSADVGEGENGTKKERWVP